MPAESISIDVFARGTDAASRNIKQVGNAALETSGKLDVAAASIALFDKTVAKQGKAAATSEAAMKSHAKAAGLLADAENVLAGRATVTTKLMADQGREFDKAAKHTEKLAGSAADAGATLGQLGHLAFPALIGAGVALAPVLVTVGLGLGGIGAAAVGLLKPVADAAAKTGGLRANLAGLDPEQRKAAQSLLSLGDAFKGFEKELAPEVFGVFNRGLSIARGLMGDLLPVSKATGSALDILLGRIDAEFASKRWQSFFTWMATQAAPDVRLLGDAFINLMDALPGLLRALNPLAVELLKDVDAALRLIGLLSQLGVHLDTSGKSAADAAHKHNLLGEAWHNAVQVMLPLLPASGKLRDLLNEQGAAATSNAAGMKALTDRLKAAHTASADLIHPAGAAAAGIMSVGDNAKVSAAHVKAMTDEVNKLNTAETKALDPQLAYANALITGANDAQALRVALKASHDMIGLHTQKERDSFAASQTYISDLENIAKQAISSGKGQDAARSAISRALPILESAKTHSKTYWQEVQILRDWLLRLNRVPNVHESIFMTGHGRWGIFGQGQGQGSIFGSGKGGSLAAGGMIRGGVSGRDSVPVLTMPGEVVVPTRMVNAGAVDHLRGSLPGFAGGGVIGSYAGGPGGLKPWGAHNWNASIHSIEHSMGNAMAHAFASAFAAASAGFMDTGARSGSAYLAQQYAARLLGSYGWGRTQFGPLLALWNQESGWNSYAVNPSSGAYGIPQSLGHGHPYNLGDYKAQIIWGLNYIRGRYGSPGGAWAHEQAFNWYDKGGFLPRGLSLAYNGTPYPEQVVPHGGGRGGTVTVRFDFSRAHNHQLADIIRDAVRVQGGGDVQVALGTSH